jgi:GTPase
MIVSCVVRPPLAGVICNRNRVRSTITKMSSPNKLVPPSTNCSHRAAASVILPSMFVDKVKTHAKAGDGGNGCVSFRREKCIEHGGPDGGNGGKGGDVVLVADRNVTDLSDLFYNPRLVAKPGDHGRGKNCYGRNAADVVVKVPVGTQVYRLTPVIREREPSHYHPAAATEVFSADASVGKPFGFDRRPTVRHGGARSGATGLSAVAPALRSSAASAGEGESANEEALAKADRGKNAAPTVDSADRELIADLVGDGQRFVLAKGGKGGRGNVVFKGSTHQVPREFEYGEAGEELRAEMELKTLADVGLVGYPNAGKSTLISKISNARPKIAAYPFTTLTPNVGVITFDDYGRALIADIPGLIDGAHAGHGLGHDFLRHIERCKLLIILLDMAGMDGRKPHDDYHQLLKELELHNPAILDKPRLVVANKMDLPAAKENLVLFKKKITTRAGRGKILEISALEGDGLDKLKLAIRKALS